MPLFPSNHTPNHTKNKKQPLLNTPKDQSTITQVTKLNQSSSRQQNQSNQRIIEKQKQRKNRQQNIHRLNHPTTPLRPKLLTLPNLQISPHSSHSPSKTPTINTL